MGRTGVRRATKLGYGGGKPPAESGLCPSLSETSSGAPPPPKCDAIAVASRNPFLDRSRERSAPPRAGRDATRSTRSASLSSRRVSTTFPLLSSAYGEGGGCVRRCTLHLCCVSAISRLVNEAHARTHRKRRHDRPRCVAAKAVVQQFKAQKRGARGGALRESRSRTVFEGVEAEEKALQALEARHHRGERDATYTADALLSLSLCGPMRRIRPSGWGAWVAYPAAATNGRSAQIHALESGAGAGQDTCQRYCNTVVEAPVGFEVEHAQIWAARRVQPPQQRVEGVCAQP